MVKTRSMTRTKKSIYRVRVKTSPCRGKKTDACRKKYGCKKTKKNVFLLNRIAIISGQSVRVIIQESTKDTLKIQIMQLPRGWVQTLNIKVP